jgi:hypothetical protein
MPSDVHNGKSLVTYYSGNAGRKFRDIFAGEGIQILNHGRGATPMMVAVGFNPRFGITMWYSPRSDG